MLRIFQSTVYMSLSITLMISYPIMAAEEAAAKGHRRTASGVFQKLTSLRKSRFTRSADELPITDCQKQRLAGSKKSQFSRSASAMEGIPVEIYFDADKHNDPDEALSKEWYPVSNERFPGSCIMQVVQSSDDEDTSSDTTDSGSYSSNSVTERDIIAFAEKNVQDAKLVLGKINYSLSLCSQRGRRIAWEVAYASTESRLNLSEMVSDIAKENIELKEKYECLLAQKERSETQKRNSHRLLQRHYEKVKANQDIIDGLRYELLQAEKAYAEKIIAYEEEIHGYSDGFPGLKQRLEMASAEYERVVAERGALLSERS